jgi:DNA-binding Xre family transcriptional regulator
MSAIYYDVVKRYFDLFDKSITSQCWFRFDYYINFLGLRLLTFFYIKSEYRKEGLCMLAYKIDVIETLKESGYNNTKILRENVLSQSAMQKLRKGEMIGIKTLEQLCDLLDMQPGNIIKYVENKP